MEALIRAVDKTNNDDPELNKQCFKRLDIVALVADGHPWTARELSAPQWRIIKMPNVGESDLTDLMNCGHDSGGTLIKRACFLDLDRPSLGQELASYLADGNRTVAFYTLNLPGNSINSLKATKNGVS